jgi:peptidyl-prolyl cis-trans isomerase SurA
MLAGFSALLVTGCSPAEHDPIVASIGSQAIPLSEFERQYLKTVGSREAAAATSLDDRQKFLDLLVKYRLKLADAYRNGLDKKPDLMAEMEGYKGNLAATYLTEREVVAPGMKRLYERRQEEFRVSHILFTLAQDASPADTAAAYAKAVDLIQQIAKGRSFEDAAFQMSQDPSAKQNKGDLYYVTGGQLISQFEDAMLALKVGEMTTVPVRTRFGYHIIKLTDRRPAPDEIRAGHIMVRFASGTPTPDDTAKAFAKAVALLDSLKAGADFGQLATRNSEDPGSASKGGDLGFFGRRRWVQQFDEVAFTLKPGQTSGIVRTAWGYHIIRCFESRPKKTFEESRQELQTGYQQARFSEDNTRYLAQLRSLEKVTCDNALVAALYAGIDTTKSVRDSAWDAGVPAQLRSKTLLMINGGPVSADSVLHLIGTRPETQSITLNRKEFAGAVEKIQDQLAFGARADQLAKERPEFRDLLTEYKEGVLLYQTEQDHIWNRIGTKDSLMLPYFNAHRESFTYPDRVSFTAIYAPSLQKAQVILSRLARGKSMEAVSSEDSIRMAKQYNIREIFQPNSAELQPYFKETLKEIGGELKADTSLRLTMTARPDTTTDDPDHTLPLARKRLDVIQKYLVRTMKVNARKIATLTVPEPPVVRRDSTAGNAVDFAIAGREQVVLGKLEHGTLAPSTDDRAKRADSLALGAYSQPFSYRGMHAIVRFDGRDKARLRTFEEAGSELASAYQEFESKRLENEWMAQLRKDFPVSVDTTVLKGSFAPKK